MQDTQETPVWSLSWEDLLEWKWKPTPGFLPGEFHRQRSLAGYSAWGHKESDMTERIHNWANNTFTFFSLPTELLGKPLESGTWGLLYSFQKTLVGWSLYLSHSLPLKWHLIFSCWIILWIQIGIFFGCPWYYIGRNSSLFPNINTSFLQRQVVFPTLQWLSLHNTF